MRKTSILLLLFSLLLCPMLPMAQAEQAAEFVDYAATLSFNRTLNTAKAEVTVHTYVDGDTVHFNVDKSVTPSGILKARFLGINTPECTGKIEEYGKKAAAFTREKLSQAESIWVESDDDRWNLDSTGDRHLVWVWYRHPGETTYRCLNLEILQNGLAQANSTTNVRYGAICMNALNQARSSKLNMYSGQKDPDFYYGDAVELTLRELRMNLEAYNGKKVAFSGVITQNHSNSVYMESFDDETGLYYGITVYYGFNLSGSGMDILSVGNESRIVGTVQYYEAGDSWQVSGLSYRAIRPNAPTNIRKLSDGHSPAYVLTKPETLNAQFTISGEDAQYTYDYAFLTTGTSIEMRDLTVTSVYTTQDVESSSNGALTLTCESNGQTVYVRTQPLRHENGSLMTEVDFLGKTICVKGIVDRYEGQYQVRVFLPENITFSN